MTTAILSVVASIGAVISAYFIQRWAVRWLQAYYSHKEKEKSEQVKKDSEDLSKKSQEESDKLKDIEGR